ncbi:MAG: DUF1592 domain-containing protein, partial [Polyangiaceae bacterium]|nr:DUF1592 domain-containing protein [Polyangiaceae bacterium]
MMALRTKDALLSLSLLSSVAVGCTGEIGDLDAVPGAPGSEPSAPSCLEGPAPGPSPIRRMTRFEYDRTVLDLLGDETNPASGFGAEEEALGFNNNAAQLITSHALVEQYMLAAEGISGRATDPVEKNLPCDPADGEDACAAEFIESFGKKAFRRPLTVEEREMFAGLYELGRQKSFRDGIRLVIEGALQSPQFLYRVEYGVEGAEPNEVVRLTSWEMASRLSFFLWGSMPDEALFAKAEAGELETSAQIEAEARRMLEDPRAHVLVAEFHKQWLDYERVANVTKDAELFPDWSPAIGQLMAEETRTFIDGVIFGDQGTLTTLLSAPYSYMNGELAAFYGVDLPSGDGGFTRVDLDPTQRAGLLTTGTLLTINAHTNQTSPTLRGRLIREQLLCDSVPPPPADVNIEAPEVDPGSTGKDRFLQHTEDPGCAGCHNLMDPIGFGFEGYDTVARFRTTEGGKPIDATGSLMASDVDGPFDGVVELAAKLAQSGEVGACYSKQWFR